jgi:serine/threonine protein kinase
LIREAQQQSVLQHPNIVTVHDAGVDDEGGFIVMELVKGETLEDIIMRGALTRRTFDSLVRQTLEGMAAAHEQGIIHLDLKPGNLMITWLPGRGASGEDSRLRSGKNRQATGAAGHRLAGRVVWLGAFHGPGAV